MPNASRCWASCCKESLWKTTSCSCPPARSCPSCMRTTRCAWFANRQECSAFRARAAARACTAGCACCGPTPIRPSSFTAWTCRQADCWSRPRPSRPITNCNASLPTTRFGKPISRCWSLRHQESQRHPRAASRFLSVPTLTTGRDSSSTTLMGARPSPTIGCWTTAV